MRMEYLGMSGVMSAVVSSEQKNALMMESMLEVSGPFYSSQGGFELSVRWGNFCMMHWEKSRRRVCWSVILSSNEVIFFGVINAAVKDIHALSI